MSIGTLPSVIAPGDPVAAGPVMANFNYLNANGQGATTSLVAALKSSGTQTFNTSASKVQFNTKAYDLNSEYDTTTYRFTSKEAGYWFIHVEMIIVNTGAQLVSLLLYRNGIAPTGAEIYSVSSLSAIPVAQSIRMSGLIQLALGDYLEVFCYCNTSTVATDASGGNRFDLIQVR